MCTIQISKTGTKEWLQLVDINFYYQNQTHLHYAKSVYDCYSETFPVFPHLLPQCWMLFGVCTRVRPLSKCCSTSRSHRLLGTSHTGLVFFPVFADAKWQAEFLHVACIIDKSFYMFNLYTSGAHVSFSCCAELYYLPVLLACIEIRKPREVLLFYFFFIFPLHAASDFCCLR